MVWHTEVAARDSIGYIRYARQLQDQPWQEVLRNTEQPPLYALAVLAVSSPIRRFVDGPDSVAMQLSAQLASAIAGVLLVIPMFLLGRELFDRGVGFWAALLFQCLPAPSRFLSDGLSEATYLLFTSLSLWLAVRGLRIQSPMNFAFSGLCAGLAYLTRTEGLLIALCEGLVLLGCQAVRSWRFSRARLLACGSTLLLGTILVGGPYMAVIGHVTNKKSHINVLNGEKVEAAPAAPPRSTLTSATGSVPLAVWWRESDGNKSWWGLWAVGLELSKGSFQVGWVAALLGFWHFRQRFRFIPGMWVLLALCTVMCAVLWRLAVVMEYLSDRHCLVILFCLTFWTVAGVKVIGAWLSSRLQPYFGEWSRTSGLWRQLIELRLTSNRAVAALLLLAVIAISLPKTLEPLHGNRAGLKQAGLWLFANADASDEIVDPYCWSHYYAGCIFREGRANDPSPGHTPIKYVVLEESKSEHQRLTGLEKARELAKRGEVVYRWSGKQGKNAAEVLVYAVR
jgi:hypothetical protein